MHGLKTWILLMIILVGGTLAHAERIPQSVRLYDAHQDQLPRMQVAGRPYGGLNRCKLLARQHEPQPFFSMPTDLGGPEACDLTRVIVAYTGFCTAGVQRQAPHFVTPLGASVEITHYEDGIVIWLNTWFKSRVLRTPEGEAAAVAFLSHPPAQIPIALEGVPLFPQEYLGALPPTDTVWQAR